MYDYKIKASVLIGTQGIDLYLGDNEIPAQTILLPDAVTEFLEAYTIDDVLVDPYAIKKIREQLNICVSMLDEVLEKEKKGNERKNNSTLKNIYADTSSKEFVEWMANAWRLNDERNKRLFMQEEVVSNSTLAFTTTE